MAADMPGNNSQRLQWFSDLGFGLFIHWSMDSQLGAVIGHSMAGASDDYLRRFIDDLPATFQPKSFDPHAWAVLAKLAGIRYVVFTTKHHSGFCMFHTETTPFGIANTPFERDITAEVIDAFRQQGIAIGLYFSPDDFHFLHSKGLPVHRGVLPADCDGLLAHNQAQMRELLTNYGRIDILFFDGPADGLCEFCWEIDADIVVTRGAMPTPEQHIPGIASAEPWEACVTMGTGWQYKPTNEQYKTGTQLLELLIETRAKGGNLLLNVGPKPDGALPIEQEALLREIALWNFVNGEAIHGVRPWRIPCEGEVWFTASEDGTVVYAHIESDTPWPQRTRKEISLFSVRAGAQTAIQVLGQADDLVAADGPAINWRQDGACLRVSVARMQRLYNNRRWPNAVVLRITDAQVGLVPPTVATGVVAIDVDRPTSSSSCQLQGRLVDLGEGGSVDVGFEYRLRKLLTDAADDWQPSARQRLHAAGEFVARITDLQPGSTYEFRAVACEPTVMVYGDSVAFHTPR